VRGTLQFLTQEVFKSDEGMILKKQIVKFLFSCGVGITSARNLEILRDNQVELLTLRRYLEFNAKLESASLPDEVRRPSLIEFSGSTGQLNQDLVALMFLDFQKDGYFVEFGATDGVRFSNTFILESRYNWKGILAEPGRNWHQALKSNRKCVIENKCVWKKSGEILKFNETEIGELSTLDMYSAVDLHADARSSGTRYDIETISLQDLLEANSAPAVIDYLSIDTEGSEFQILEGLDFDKFSFKFISCEHNFTDTRELVRKLLEGNGYVRILEEMSSFDDWYISQHLAKSKGLI
jgi:FkbM family methyltransferase